MLRNKTYSLFFFLISCVRSESFSLSLLCVLLLPTVRKKKKYHYCWLSLWNLWYLLVCSFSSFSLLFFIYFFITHSVCHITTYPSLDPAQHVRWLKRNHQSVNNPPRSAAVARPATVCAPYISFSSLLAPPLCCYWFVVMRCRCAPTAFHAARHAALCLMADVGNSWFFRTMFSREARRPIWGCNVYKFVFEFCIDRNWF